MHLLSTFNKKVNGWGGDLCFMYVFVMPVYASNLCILQKIYNSALWGHTFRWVTEFGVTPALKTEKRVHPHCTQHSGVGSNVLQVTQMSKKLLFSDKKYFSRSFFKSVILLLLE